MQQIFILTIRIMVDQLLLISLLPLHCRNLQLNVHLPTKSMQWELERRECELLMVMLVTLL